MQHEGDKRWWPAVQRRAETWYETHREAEAAERATIGWEAPLYNRTDENGANQAPRDCPASDTHSEAAQTIQSLLKAGLRAGRYHRFRFLPTPVELGRHYGRAARDVYAALDELQSVGLVNRVGSNRYVPTNLGQPHEETARGLMLQEVIAGLGKEPFTRQEIRSLTGRSAFVVDQYVTLLVDEGRLQVVEQLVPESRGRAAVQYVVAAAELAAVGDVPKERRRPAEPPSAGKATRAVAIAELNGRAKGATPAERGAEVAAPAGLQFTVTASPGWRSHRVSFRKSSILKGCTVTDPDRLKRVDALLDDVLPPPPVRAKLRLAAGLTQQEVAEAVGVKRLAVARWELGQTHPRRPHRAAYMHLLNRLAERYPDAAKPDEGMPTPASEGGSG
ncbi:helix-turn-helix transcriptional regulator [Streptomyces sannanensis]|uniref:helix-turn-helix transcriptional regulator n=1 Tax=Streptomyces sannanensis TaxID=285536 RepID=UPI0031EB858C